MSNVVALCVLVFWSEAFAELWEKEVGSEMTIGPATSGYKRVALRCEPDDMDIEVEMDEDFSGVMYTRGSFHQREPPCFLDAEGGTTFSLRLPFKKCKTTNENEVYKNILVIQHDDELIMPGDAAFSLECDFRNRNVTVDSSLPLSSTSSVISSIGLADPDPAGKELPKHRRSTVSNQTRIVSFTPDDVRPRRKKRASKDEL